MLRRMRCHKVLFVTSSLFAVLNALAIVVYASVMQRVIDGLGGSSVWIELRRLLCVGGMHVIAFWCFRSSCNYLFASVCVKQRAAFVEKLGRISIENLDCLNIGHLLALYNDDINRISEFIGKQLPIIFADVGFLIIAFVYFTMRSLIIAVTVLFVSIILLPFFMKVAERTRTNGQDRQLALDQISTTEENIVRGIRDIKVNNAERWMEEKYKTVARSFSDRDFAFLKAKNQTKALLGLQYNVGLLVVLLVCGFALSYESLTLGDTVAIYALYARFSSGIRKISSYFANYNALKSNLKRLEDIEHIPEEYSGSNGSKGFFPIRIIRLSYAYDKKHNALENIRLDLQEGDNVALIGGSGGGKSTLAKLLCAYTDQYVGDIFFGESECRTIAPVEIRKRVKYVSNDFYLAVDVVEALIQSANVERLIRWTSVMELEHLIQPTCERRISIRTNAENLSGGERQRLILLLAVLEDAEIYVFDEMLSAIQRELALCIFCEMKRVKHATMIWITHQMDILPMSGSVILMEAGHIIARGTHDRLLNECESYRQLLRAFAESAVQ